MARSGGTSLSYKTGDGRYFETVKEARSAIRWRFDIPASAPGRELKPLTAADLREIRDHVVEGEPTAESKPDVIDEILDAVGGDPEGRSSLVRADLDALLEWSKDGVEGTSWDG